MKGLERDSCIDARSKSVKERRRRANIFAQAWLFRVSKKVKSFKNNKVTMEHVNKPVDAYVDKKYGATLDYIQEPVETKAPDYDDIMLGMHAAADVSLFRPLKKMNNHLLLAAVS